tara:strand:- start:1746 stop:2516 length:771 start_codon:yes stop_codon:yes gene_type:complete
MNPKLLKKLLRDLASGKTDPQSAFEKIKNLPYENLGFARVDHHRSLRAGAAETIFCAGKSSDQIIKIVTKIYNANNDVLGTRLEKKIFKEIEKQLPGKTEYHSLARVLTVRRNKKLKPSGRILVATAGTSDIPIAEEAAITAEFFGSRVERVFDIGVAGIHRLFDQLNKLRRAQVLITVAGMDGALPSVIGGLVDKPVIAVPTSIGYGASFEGLAALLTMLNSCAPGVAVVNIDNGFGAGTLAHKINHVIMTSKMR